MSGHSQDPKGTFKHPIAKICPFSHVKNELQFHHHLGGAGMFMQGTNLLNYYGVKFGFI